MPSCGLIASHHVRQAAPGLEHLVPTSLDLVLQGLMGPFLNRDGRIDGADLRSVPTHIGLMAGTPAKGDVNGVGVVDPLDLAVVAGNLDTSS